jgi:hypothetical protein
VGKAERAGKMIYTWSVSKVTQPSLNKSQKLLKRQRALFGQRWNIFGNKTVRSVWMNVIQMEFG